MLVGLSLIRTFVFRNECPIGLGWAAIDSHVWPRPYVVQNTPTPTANQTDTPELFALAKSGWKTSKNMS